MANPTDPATAGRPVRTRPSSSSEQAVRWIVRALWATLPFTAGPALADALDGASRPVQLVATLELWAGWATGVLAAFVALPVSATALRMLAPAALVAVAAASAGGHTSPLALGWTGVATGWVYAPSWGALCVNGPAYPNERRFLLRAPGPLLFGPLALAWAIVVTGFSAGPLLLAAHRWVAGAIVCAVGLPIAVVLQRAVHDLSRRWAVLVPAGLVVHDPLTVLDPLLLRRRSVTRIGPALAGTDALDLTQKAPGLAVEVDLNEEVALALIRPGRREPQSVRADRLLLTPTRPGALLDEARRRRFPVGSADQALGKG